MKKEIVLQITETGREHLKVPSESFNVIVEYFRTREDLKKYLIDRYGCIPKGKNKIYVDEVGDKPQAIGFTYSFWNQDVSHNSHKWYQTDWITFYEQIITKSYFKLTK